MLVRDPEFRKVCELYSKDSEVFTADFAKAYKKLTELGFSGPAAKPWYQFW